MPTAFEKTIAQFITANGLFAPSGGILVAVSGGADSMALMYALYLLCRGEPMCSPFFGQTRRSAPTAAQNANLIVAHINHQLRGRDADEDEAFVIAQANILGLPVVTRRVAVAEFAKERKLSVETAARQMRMDALIEIAKEKGCAYIAAAHHKDDNAETIVHRLLRGTGFRGLAGIRPTKKFDSGITFVRPLLCVSRKQILAYLEKSKIQWRHDHTNDDQAFTRNFIRHSLLPLLQSQSRDSLIEILNELSSHCCRYADSLDSQADQLWPRIVLKKEDDRIELDKNIFAAAPTPLKPELIRRALLAIGSGERDITQRHYQRVLRFAETTRIDKKILLPHGFAVRGGKGLIFEKLMWHGHPARGFSCAVLPLPGAVDFDKWRIETQILDAKACDLQKFKSKKTRYVEWFDADKIAGMPKIRPRKSGDSFWPIGLAAPKKIGKFLTDAHIDSEMRKSVCVVEDGEKIIWLAPIRTSEETKVTAATKKILQITCTSNE
jgi:tRNA(Ile)-lysidine synthase